jgi:hypothetical protein
MGLSLLPDDLDACRLRLTRRRVNWRFLAACSAQNDMQGHVALKTGDWTLHSTGKAVVAASRCDGAETRMPGTWYAVMQAADWAGGRTGWKRAERRGCGCGAATALPQLGPPGRPA